MAVLSLSTYGKQLCGENDDEAKRKIQNLVLPTFEHRLELELAMLYIKEHMSLPCTDCREYDNA